MRRRALGIALVSTTMACSYPEFGFVPDDAIGGDTATAFDTAVDDTTRADTLDGGATDTSLVDSATTDTTIVDTAATDTAIADTKTDTLTPADTLTPPDTRTDTPDTTPLGFCASASPPHAFCNDFDSSTVVTYGWSSYDLTTPDGAESIETTTLAKSSPHCLRTTLTSPAVGAFTAASVNRTLDAPFFDSLTRFEADIRLDTGSYGSTAGTLLMKMQRSGGNGIGFGIDADGFYIEMVGTDYHYHQLTTPVPGATWFHVRVEGVLKAVGGSASVWIDGVPAGTFTGESTAETPEGTNRNFVIGLYADPPIANFGVRYDNATVDFP